MSKAQYFNLQPNEIVIFQAAANIYSGYVQSGQVTSENSTEIMKKAIGASISIARTVEKIVQSDGEIPT